MKKIIRKKLNKEKEIDTKRKIGPTCLQTRQVLSTQNKVTYR